MLVVSLVLNVVIVVAILLAVRRPKEQALLAAALPNGESSVTDLQRSALRERLLYERNAKLVGGLVGFMLPGALKAWVELPTVINPFTVGFAGLLLGVVFGAARESAPSGSRRSAQLRERRIDRYAPTNALWWARGLTVLAVVAASLSGVVGRLIGACTHPDMARSAATPVIAAAFALVASAMVEIGIRRIVRRPQRAESDGLVAIDDLLRARAVANATAAGLAGIILSLTLVLSTTLYNGPVCGSAHEWTRVALVDIVVGVGGFVTAFAVWISLSQRQLPRTADAPTVSRLRK